MGGHWADRVSFQEGVQRSRRPCRLVRASLQVVSGNGSMHYVFRNRRSEGAGRAGSVSDYAWPIAAKADSIVVGEVQCRHIAVVKVVEG